MDDRQEQILTDGYDQFLAERAELENRYFTLKMPKKYRYWYLATVYSSYPHGHDAACTDAAKMAALCFSNHIPVFCPITHSHPMVPFLDPSIYNHEFWMQMDYMFLDNALGLIVTKMDNWENSKGIALEIEYTKKLGKPVIYTEFMKVPNINGP
jgi:hypothetical protein